MTPRSIRRAAERKRNKRERKLARELENSNLTNTAAAAQPALFQEGLHDEDVLEEELCFSTPAEAEPSHAPAISAAQLAANRANAQLSTGPTTAQGKAKTSLNAVKTALTGRTVLLHSDDVAEYQRYLTDYEKELQPVGRRESDLVQSIVDTVWRLRRIPGLETAIFARGYLEFENVFNAHAPGLRPGMIELETFVKYEKQLRNLQLQDARLGRRREKEFAELRHLQQERKAKETAALNAAARQYVLAKKNNAPFTQSANGFEFSTAEIERYLAGCSPTWFARLTAQATDGRLPHRPTPLRTHPKLALRPPNHAALPALQSRLCNESPSRFGVRVRSRSSAPLGSCLPAGFPPVSTPATKPSGPVICAPI